MKSYKVLQILQQIGRLNDSEKQELLESLDLGEISLEHINESVQIYGSNMRMGGADLGRCPKCGRA
ncbi:MULTISPECIES: hypothetical protein [Achromobacter]|uniref:hypothetical protein n=1 Tax=Achromobacter TaxID=222 RepID=UPI0014660264|nr:MULTISPECIES: hypothetical protein [Achromobacter]BDD44060.1 hypothetical protein 6 [Prochloraceae cyanobacterium]CAB3643030.1 hypothetical protein LMG26840_02209 [Achromobacter dolens]